MHDKLSARRDDGARSIDCEASVLKVAIVDQNQPRLEQNAHHRHPARPRPLIPLALPIVSPAKHRHRAHPHHQVPHHHRPPHPALPLPPPLHCRVPHLPRCNRARLCVHRRAQGDILRRARREARDRAEEEGVVGRERRVVEAPVGEVVEVPGRGGEDGVVGGRGRGVEEGKVEGVEGGGGEGEPVALGFEVAAEGRGRLACGVGERGSAQSPSGSLEKHRVPE